MDAKRSATFSRSATLLVAALCVPLTTPGLSSLTVSLSAQAAPAPQDKNELQADKPEARSFWCRVFGAGCPDPAKKSDEKKPEEKEPSPSDVNFRRPGGVAINSAPALDLSTMPLCDKPLGKVLIVGPATDTAAQGRNTTLPPASALDTLVTKSGCFVVIDRAAVQRVLDERAMASSSSTAAGRTPRLGGVFGADYVLTWTVNVDETPSGVSGITGGLGGILGNQKAAQPRGVSTGLRLAQTDDGTIVASSDSSVRNASDASAVDTALSTSYKELVARLRAQTLERASYETRALAPGDVVHAGQSGVRVLASPSATAVVMGTIGAADEAIVTGAEQNGFVPILTRTLSGWVLAGQVARP